MAADGNLGLGVMITLDDGFSTKAKGIGSAMDNVATKAFKFNQVTEAITNVTSALSQFTEPFVQLDKQVKNIGTLGVENFEEFAGLTTELSKKVPDDAAKLAEGVYTAISAGIQGTNEEVLSFVEVASKAAVAGGSTTQAAVDGLTSVMNSYKIETKGAGEVSDTFFAAIKLGKTTFPEMNRAIANVVPTASALGVGFDEVSASIAQMTALGVPTTIASTQLRQSMVELQKPGKDLAAVMAKVGLNAGNIKKKIKDEGLINVMQKIEAEAAKSGKSMTQVFSSVEAGAAALLLTGENAETATKRLADVRKEIQAGVSTAAYDTAAAGIGVKFEIMKNNVQAVFNDMFLFMGDGVVNGIQMFNQFAPAISSVMPAISLVQAGMTALKSTTLGMAIAEKAMGIASIFTTGGLWGMATAAWAAVAPFLPFILIGAAVVGVIVLIWTNIDTLVGWFKQAVDWVFNLSDTVLFLLGPIGLVIIAIKNWGAIVEWIGDAWDSFVEMLMNGINAAIDWIVEFADWFLFLLGPIGAIIFAIMNWETVGPWLQGLWDDIVTSTVNTFTGLVDWFMSIPTMLFQVGQNMVLAIKDGMSAAWGILADFLLEGISALPGGSAILDFFGVGGGGEVSTDTSDLGGGDLSGVGTTIAQSKASGSTPTVIDKSTQSTELKEIKLVAQIDSDDVYTKIIEKDELEEGRG